MRAAGGVVEGGLGELLLDAGVDAIAGKLVEIVVERRSIAVVSGHRHQVQAAAQAAAPFHRHVEVGIPESSVAAERECIPGPVGYGLDGVPVVKLVGDARVKVAEIGASPVVVAACRHDVQQPVGVCGAASHDEGGPALYQRSFQVETAGEQAYAERAFYLVGVAFASADVQHRRYAPAELRRDGTLVQLHFADDVGVERRENAEQVRGVVQRAVVEQDKVLVGGASADVEAAGSLAHRLDARERQDGLDYVSFAEGGGYLGYDVDPHALQTYLCVAVVGHCVRGDDRSGQGCYLLFHHDVQSAVVINLEVQVHVVEGVAAQAELAVADGQRDAVESVRVGDGIGAAAGVVD